MSISSESDDDCYKNCAQKLQALKTEASRKMELIEINDEDMISGNDTVDASCSTTSEVSSNILAKTKKKKLKHRIRPKKMCNNPEDSTTSFEEEKRKTQRANRSMARRANRNDAENIANMMTPLQAILGNIRRSTNRRGNASSSRSRRRNTSNRSRNQAYSINIGCSSDDETSQPLFAKQKDQDSDKSIISNSSADNHVVNMKVIWMSSEHYFFDLRRFEKLTSIYKFFAQKSDVPFTRLLFTLQNKILCIDDTPKSIGYKSYHIIDGGVVSTDISNPIIGSSKVTSTTDKNMVTLLFQCMNRKTLTKISIPKSSDISMAMVQFSEEIEVPLSKMQFKFDGDILKGNESLESLDIEGNEIIDVHILA